MNLSERIFCSLYPAILIHFSTSSTVWCWPSDHAGATRATSTARDRVKISRRAVQHKTTHPLLVRRCNASQKVGGYPDVHVRSFLISSGQRSKLRVARCASLFIESTASGEQRTYYHKILRAREKSALQLDEFRCPHTPSPFSF